MKTILKRLNCFILVLTLSISSGLCACSGSVYVDDPDGMDSSGQRIEKVIEEYDEIIRMAQQSDFDDKVSRFIRPLLRKLDREDIVNALDNFVSDSCHKDEKVDDAFLKEMFNFLCDNYKEFLTPNEPKIVILIAILLGLDYNGAYEWLQRCTS